MRLAMLSLYACLMDALSPRTPCRCYKNVFYLVTLVYPRCAQTCLQLFSVTKLDIGSFLSADFTILVRDTAGHWGRVYVRYLAPGIALLLVFAIGLPIWYFYIMWTVRRRLRVRRSPFQSLPLLVSRDCC